MQRAGGDTAKTPMNIMGVFEPRKTGPYDEMLGTIGKALQEEKAKGETSNLKKLAPEVDFGKIGKCLENKPLGLSKLFSYNWYASDANKELAKLQKAANDAPAGTDEEKQNKAKLTVLAATLKDALYAKKEINTTHVGRPDTSNFCGVIKQVAHEASKGCLSTIGNDDGKALKKIQIITQCASGKDRTGLTEARNTQEAIQNHLGFNGKEKDDIVEVVTAQGIQEKTIRQITEENLKTQLNAGQQTVESQLNAGSIGCFGIKGDTKWAVKNSDLGKNDDQIVLKSAKENKVKVDKHEKGDVLTIQKGDEGLQHNDKLDRIFGGKYKQQLDLRVDGSILSTQSSLEQLQQHPILNGISQINLNALKGLEEGSHLLGKGNGQSYVSDIAKRKDLQSQQEGIMVK